MKDRPFSQTVKGRKKYNPSEYFTLTLSEPFANGAIGTVHRASAQFEVDSITVEYHELVVKFAFQGEHQEELRREYKIYQHMAKIGYTANILRVHGLFQDFETGLLAMVMDYGGLTLGTTKGNQPFTEKGQKVLWDALQDLHSDANVLHGDIKANNIVVDSSGNVYFIDFHRARVLVDTHPDSFEYDCDALVEMVFP
ncbi:hypothetical protein M413DRAFT_158022 [Hebeloma cylindrosporum]|uniref:Protein kinase domain-containing protein n=1 Tax=Hebeloma cylindrosporum TaxID=76867 RepID=A0A0C2XTL1_HEBCY|nr:hypothetical protein M413DRAFT_158022 [Hebeloma cylindrosporum h7]